MLPAIKEKMKQIQEVFSKMETKEMQNKIQQATRFVKKQLQDLKKSSENNEMKIRVTNADAIKQIRQVRKELEALQKQQIAR